MPDYPQTPESIQRAQIAQVVERALFRMETGYDVDAQGRIQHDGRQNADLCKRPA